MEDYEPLNEGDVTLLIADALTRHPAATLLNIKYQDGFDVISYDYLDDPTPVRVTFTIAAITIEYEED